MKLRGGSFGLVILVIVMGVVLLLVAQAWKKMAPAAIEVTGSGPGSGASVSDHGQTGASAEVRSGGLPDLDATRSQTDAHAEDVQEAMKAIE